MHFDANNALYSMNCEPEEQGQFATKLSSPDVYSVKQTSVFMNKDVHILCSSEDIAQSSTVCLALTEELPHHFTYGAGSGLWFIMPLNTAHVKVRFNDIEESLTILPSDVFINSNQAPIEVHLQNPIKAFHVFIKNILVDEVTEKFYQSGKCKILLPANIVRSNSTTSVLIQSLREVLKSFAPKSELLMEYTARSLIVDFLQKFTEETVEPSFDCIEETLNPSQLKRVLEYIDNKLASSIRTNDLAAIAGVSRTNFIKRFNTSMHYTPARYIFLTRIKRARKLLKQSDLSISFIASACGFSDVAHLSTSFRRETGVTPSVYRKERNLDEY